MSEPVRVYLWRSGTAEGTAGSPGRAFDLAAPYLTAGAAAVVEEVRVVMGVPGGDGLVTGYSRTGKRWRGQLADGVPAWEQDAPAAPVHP